MEKTNSIAIAAIGVSIVACSAAGDAPVGSSQSASTTGSGAPSGGAAARFESASIAVPVGSQCVIHPEGNNDPKESIAFGADADGVARFQAVRATQPGAVERLALDCTDANGNAQSYPMNLRSDETFAPRPFDAARAGLETRPALTGDPLSYTTAELIQQGYGYRPDATTSPAAYKRWLAAVSTPMRKHRRAAAANGPEGVSSSAVQPPMSVIAASSPSVPTTNAGVTTAGEYCGGSPPGCYWTGAILTGDYKPSLTQGYALNEASFVLPPITPGGYGTTNTEMFIWTGLDNAFQSIVWVQTTSTVAKSFFNTQEHMAVSPNQPKGTGDPSFTPAFGDDVYAEEWYCDASGNLNLTGGYGCTFMVDLTSGDGWDCNTSNSTTCPSFWLASGDVVGTQAEFIVENDGAQDGSTYNWPAFSSITMTGSAIVVRGSNTSVGDSDISVDPAITLAADWPPTGLPNGAQVSVALSGADSVVWTQYGRSTLVGNEKATQITDGNGGCLDLPNGNTTNGTLLHIWQCDSNGLNQTWFVDSAGSIHYGANPLKCIDFPAQDLVNGVPTDETQLQIWDCNNHAGPDQMWKLTPASSGYQIQFAADTAKCVELRNGSSANNTPVQIFDCNGTTGQSWFSVMASPVQPIQVQDGNGACLQPHGGATANGTLLELDVCTASGAGQGWFWDGYGSLHLAAAPGQCLDVPAQDWGSNGLPVNLTQLQIWACDNGTSRASLPGSRRGTSSSWARAGAASRRATGVHRTGRSCRRTPATGRPGRPGSRGRSGRCRRVARLAPRGCARARPWGARARAPIARYARARERCAGRRSQRRRTERQTAESSGVEAVHAETARVAAVTVVHARIRGRVAEVDVGQAARGTQRRCSGRAVASISAVGIDAAGSNGAAEVLEIGRSDAVADRVGSALTIGLALVVDALRAGARIDGRRRRDERRALVPLTDEGEASAVQAPGAVGRGRALLGASFVRAARVRARFAGRHHGACNRHGAVQERRAIGRLRGIGHRVDIGIRRSDCRIGTGVAEPAGVRASRIRAANPSAAGEPGTAGRTVAADFTRGSAAR